MVGYPSLLDIRPGNLPPVSLVVITGDVFKLLGTYTPWGVTSGGGHQNWKHIGFPSGNVEMIDVLPIWMQYISQYKLADSVADSLLSEACLRHPALNLPNRVNDIYF